MSFTYKQSLSSQNYLRKITCQRQKLQFYFRHLRVFTSEKTDLVKYQLHQDIENNLINLTKLLWNDVMMQTK